MVLHRKVLQMKIFVSNTALEASSALHHHALSCNLYRAHERRKIRIDVNKPGYILLWLL